MDGPHYAEIWFCEGARIEEPRSCACFAGHAPGTRARLDGCIYYRRPARSAIRRQAGAGAAGALDRCAHGGVSYCAGEGLDSEYVGSVDDSEAVFTGADAGES